MGKENDEIRFEINDFNPNELGRRLHMLPCLDKECAEAGGKLNYSYTLKGNQTIGRIACWRCQKQIPLEGSKLLIVVNDKHKKRKKKGWLF